MSDTSSRTAFAFQLPPSRTRAQHTEDVRREYFKNKLKMIANDVERAQDYCRELIRTGADVSEELKELEATGHALVLVALLLKREASNAA